MHWSIEHFRVRNEGFFSLGYMAFYPHCGCKPRRPNPGASTCAATNNYFREQIFCTFGVSGAFGLETFKRKL
jgi:hypothetical protein